MAAAGKDVRRAFDWTFRSRKTGRITVVQWPNLPLAVAIVAAVTHALTRLTGRTGTALSVVTDAALAVWAVMEIGWGVNPFRRALGAVILIAGVVMAVR